MQQVWGLAVGSRKGRNPDCEPGTPLLSYKQANSCILPLPSLVEKGGTCRDIGGKTKSPAVSEYLETFSRIT